MFTQDQLGSLPKSLTPLQTTQTGTLLSTFQWNMVILYLRWNTLTEETHLTMGMGMTTLKTMKIETKDACCEFLK